MKTPEERIHDLEIWQTRIVFGGGVLVACILAFIGIEKWSAIPQMVDKAAQNEVEKQFGKATLDKIKSAAEAADKVLALQNAQDTFTASLDLQHVAPHPKLGPYSFSCFIPTRSNAPAVGSVPGLSNTGDIGLLLVATLQHKDTKEWGVYIRVDFKGPPKGEPWQMSVNVVQPGSQGSLTPAAQPYAHTDDY